MSNDPDPDHRSLPCDKGDRVTWLEHIGPQRIARFGTVDSSGAGFALVCPDHINWPPTRTVTVRFSQLRKLTRYELAREAWLAAMPYIQSMSLSEDGAGLAIQARVNHPSDVARLHAQIDAAYQWFATQPNERDYP